MKAIDYLKYLKGGYFKKKILLIAIVLGMTTVLVQCDLVYHSQRWPENERKTEDRMFSLQQTIGNGLGSGELTHNEAQTFLIKLDNLRRDYTVLRERKTTQKEWDPIITKLDELEGEIKKVRAYPSRIDETQFSDRMFLLQQTIGNGLGSGELTPNESQAFMTKLDNLRRDYTVLRERKTTQKEWDPLIATLNELEEEVKKVRAYPSRIDETRLEDWMIVLQRKIDDGMLIGRLPRVRGREFQLRLDEVRREFLQRIKDQPLTSDEKGEISGRLDTLESDINNFW